VTAISTSLGRKSRHGYLLPVESSLRSWWGALFDLRKPVSLLRTKIRKGNKVVSEKLMSQKIRIVFIYLGIEPMAEQKPG